ncbi:MAG: CDP-alcohol phosphatidyltransferase family protein [Parabacteroides sp.]
MKQDKIKSTYKSNDTEEWLDRVWTRPIGYAWACLFKRLGIHPNTVTVLSMLIGASSAFFFAHGSYRTEGMTGLWYNIAAICLLAWANFYDSADGQLARMTGQKTRLGRILDGAASEVWFIPIYVGLVYRFYCHHDLEFGWLGWENNLVYSSIATLWFFLLVLYSGFVCHSRQCALADYYRQIHLFFLQGKKGSELDTSSTQQALYDRTPWTGNILWKLFLKSYINYTQGQEQRTPAFQRLWSGLIRKYGTDTAFPRAFCDQFRAQSLPLMKWTNILTFNTRAIVLYVTCLADLPWVYFLFEVFILGGLCQYMRWQHERMCNRLYATECQQPS